MRLRRDANSRALTSCRKNTKDATDDESVQLKAPSSSSQYAKGVHPRRSLEKRFQCKDPRTVSASDVKKALDRAVQTQSAFGDEAGSDHRYFNEKHTWRLRTAAFSDDST